MHNANIIKVAESIILVAPLILLPLLVVYFSF